MKKQNPQHRAIHSSSQQEPCTYANAAQGSNTNAMLPTLKLQRQASHNCDVLFASPCPPQAPHMNRTMFSRIRNFAILCPAATLVSHELLDLGIVMWAFRRARNLGLILWHRIGVSLTQNLAYSRYILGDLMCGISPSSTHLHA